MPENNSNTIVTFPYWGNYTPVFEKLMQKLSLQFIAPEETNAEAVRNGSKLSPELFCFPFKVNVGNYLKAIEKGANTILMWENVNGICRLRYYWIVQEKILKDAGHDIRFVNLNAHNVFSQIKSISPKNVSYFQFAKLFLAFLTEIMFVEKLERKFWYYQPREKNRGETEKTLKLALADFKEAKTYKDFLKIKKTAWKRFSQISLDENKKILQVGLLGEIYTVSDSKINFEMEKKLGEMGVQIHRDLNLSGHLLSGFFWKEKPLQFKIRSYLKADVGGHGREAIAEILDYTKKGFDGIIQLLPFGCMPEVTVRPILQRISEKNKTPFLSISLDEQSGEAGIQTRIEAFVDLMKSKRGIKQI